MAADREDQAVAEIGRAAGHFVGIDIVRIVGEEAVVREVRVERVQAARGSAGRKKLVRKSAAVQVSLIRTVAADRRSMPNSLQLAC